MTYDELITDINWLLKTNDSEYPKADKTRNINVWYHKVVTMILRSQDEWDFDDPNHSDYAILTSPLVKDQRDYKIPTSEKVLKIKRVDVTYDGSKYYKAEPFDINEDSQGHGDADDVDQRFDKTNPFYDMKKTSIFLYPRPDTSDGEIRVEWTREIDEFTIGDSTQEPGIDEPFHRMLSLGAAFDFALREGDTDVAEVLKSQIDEYEFRLAEHYSDKQKDRHLVLDSVYDNNYGR